MLSYALAIAVGLSSLVLFLTAFLMPKIHRQDDFLWSGVGLFYAIVLWFCATNIHGAVLLGQLAAVALLCSYTWQVVTLRKVIAEPEEPNLAASFSFTGFFGKLLNRSSESDSSETSISEETSASEEESSDTDTKGQEVSATEDITSETATEDSPAETVETISETEDPLNDSESLDTGDITSEIEDSPDITESTVLEAGDSEDSMETIETKIDEIFQEKDVTETDSNFEIEDSTVDTDTEDLTSKEVESSNWENELSNWDKEESSSQENQESVDNKKITLEELVSLESNKGEESTETTNDESQPSGSDQKTPIDRD